ncbi:hypothetical protein ES702_01276 [subsurface metagenome]
MRILLQPASGKEARKHFKDTIDKGVLFNYLKDKISTEHFKKLKLMGEEYIKVWGIVPTPDNQPRNQWSDLKEGDLALFYAKKRFYYITKVYLKAHYKDLAIDLWGFDKDDRTWEYIYFVEKGKKINLPYKPQILGYKKNHIIQGAHLLDEYKSNIFKEYIEKHEPGATDFERTTAEIEEEIIKLSRNLEDKPVKGRISSAKVLAGNQKFAHLVKERAKYICEICGQKPFIQKNGNPYAEAHHILELSKSRIESPKYMICLCPTCHRVIHHGNDQSLIERKRLKINEENLKKR